MVGPAHENLTSGDADLAGIEGFLAQTVSGGKKYCPLYKQLYRRICDGIDQGIFTPENSLPSERALCEITGLSRVTVRKAIAVLSKEGRVSRVQGAGTVVNEHRPQPHVPLVSGAGGTVLMNAPTFCDHSTWIERGVVGACAAAAEIFDIELMAQIIQFAWVVRKDDRVTAVERVKVPIHHVSVPSDIIRSADPIVKMLHGKTSEVSLKIDAAKPGLSDQQYFAAPDGASGLAVRQIASDVDGRAMVWVQSFFLDRSFEVSIR